MNSIPRKPDPSDVTDEEWAFVAPYLTPMTPDAPQRRHDPREVVNAVRWMVRAGSPWRYLPTNFPPWAAVYQQARRSMEAGCFAAMVPDLRALLRWADGRADEPTAVILDSRTLQSTPESGARGGYDGHQKRTGGKGHLAVDTLGHLLAPRVTPANAQDRDQVAASARAVQEPTGTRGEVAFVDQAYTGPTPEAAAAEHGIRLEVVRLPEAKRGFVRLPRRWVVERSCAWTSRFRRLARDDERLPETVAAPHVVAFACLMAHRLLTRAAQSPEQPLIDPGLGELWDQRRSGERHPGRVAQARAPAVPRPLPGVRRRRAGRGLAGHRHRAAPGRGPDHLLLLRRDVRREPAPPAPPALADDLDRRRRCRPQPPPHLRPPPRPRRRHLPRVLGRYVREEGILTLEEAIRKMTSAVASRLRLADRDLLRPGFWADVVLFDPETVTDHATFADPHQLSTGIRDVWVNGIRVIQAGEHTGELPGRRVHGPAYRLRT
jgi:transposase